MRHGTAAGLAACFFGLLLGCAPTRHWTSTPAFTTLETPQFEAQLIPLHSGKNFINQFRLVIANRTDKPMELDWFNTHYLLNGTRRGRFFYEGLDPSAVKNPPPETIPAGQEYVNVITPLSLIAWRGAKPGYEDLPAFSAGPVPEGENGILLVLKQGEQVYRETLSVVIRVEAR